MLDQKGIENIYSLKTNFLEFGIFKHRVGNYLNGFVNLNLQLRPINSFFNSIIYIDRKGANTFYKILNSNEGNICLDLSNKWKHKTEIQIEVDELINAFIVNHRTNVNMYMRYIQYRILHYRISTNRELVKMNTTHDDKCSFCGEVETLEHLVYKCIKADSFWLDITWIKTLGFDNYILDAKTITLGELRGKYKLLNIIILATKMVIYSN